MAVIARYLVDTSAAARMHHERVAQRVAPSITAGLVATYAPLDLEALFSVRGPRDDELIRADRPAAHEYLPVLDGHWHRAMDVQRSLAAVSRHRGVGLSDLVVAAAAEEHRITVLHYDAISEFTRRAGTVGR